MEKHDKMSEWLYYEQGAAIADIPDKRIFVGIANVMSEDDPVDVFEIEGQIGTENFTDYVVEDEEKLAFYRKVLLYFTREGAPDLTDAEQARLDGLRFVIGEDSEDASTKE